MQHRLFVCDQCGKEERLGRDSEGIPEGWWMVDPLSQKMRMLITTPHRPERNLFEPVVLCSGSCLRDFGADQGPRFP